jgi:hypothetical protein
MLAALAAVLLIVTGTTDVVHALTTLLSALGQLLEVASRFFG